MTTYLDEFLSNFIWPFMTSNMFLLIMQNRSIWPKRFYKKLLHFMVKLPIYIKLLAPWAHHPPWKASLGGCCRGSHSIFDKRITVDSEVAVCSPLEGPVWSRAVSYMDISHIGLRFSQYKLMGECKKDITLLLRHWSYIFLALTNHVIIYAYPWYMLLAPKYSHRPIVPAWITGEHVS